MGIINILGTISCSPFMANRAFGSLFVVSLLCCPQLEFIIPKTLQHFDELAIVAWIGNPYVVAILVVLALLEGFAEKISDIQELLGYIKIPVSIATGAILTIVMLDGDTAKNIIDAPLEAGWPVTTVVALVVCTLTFFLAKMRADLYSAWIEFDEEDVFKIRLLVSFIEDAWGIFGFLIFLFFPIVAVVCILLLFLMIFIVKKYLNYLENKDRIPCDGCQYKLSPSASVCPKCKNDVKLNYLWNWNMLFERVDKSPLVEIDTTNLNSHYLRLLSQRRCPACAEKMNPQTIVDSGCTECGFTFDSISYKNWSEDYVDAIISRGGMLFLPITLISILPIVGYSFAIVFIKIFISGPLTVLISKPKRFGLKWLMRLINLILLIPSAIPFVSIVTVPLLLWIHIIIYGYVVKKSIKGLQNAKRPSINIKNKIKDLKEMFEDNLITEEEFQTTKQQLLDEI